MGQNQSRLSPQQEEVLIKNAIKQNYNEEEQKLSFAKHSHHWIKILQYKSWSKLRQLLLNCCKITPATISVLSQKDWSKLQVLVLSTNVIGSTGIKIFSKIELPQLKQLRLVGCCIGDEGVKHLVKKQQRQLQRLFLTDNKIRFDGFIALSLRSWQFLELIQLNSHRKKAEMCEFIQAMSLTINRSKNIEFDIEIRGKSFKKMWRNLQKPGQKLSFEEQLYFNYD